MFSKFFIFTCLGVLLLTFSYGQDYDRKIDELLTAYSKQYKFNGSILVARGEKVLIEKGYGWKNIDGKLPNDAGSIYQIGSVTKMFTSAVIMKLREQGKIKLTDKVSKYYPEITSADKITIENLLTHTSGLYNYTENESFMKTEATNAQNQKKMLALFQKEPLKFEPGTKYQYSNSNYMLLGYIIEKITGKSYEKTVREFILNPLKMKQSGFDFTHLISAEKTIGYSSYDGSGHKNIGIVDSSVSFAAGALYSSVRDLYLWTKATYTSQILKPESWKMSFTPYKDNYAFGWGQKDYYGHLAQGHSGGIYGFNSQLTRIPDQHIAIILISNVNTSQLESLTDAITAILFDKPYEIPKEKTELTLSPVQLKEYEGEYVISPNFSLHFFMKNENLMTQATGQEAFPVYAEKKDTFFLKVVEASVEFKRDGTGSVDGLILHQNGAEIYAKKKN